MARSDFFLGLERHHSVFDKLVEFSDIEFDDKIPTAGIKFDKKGKWLSFKFNPDFYEQLTHQERQFVFCHEALHVILNHGHRFAKMPSWEKANIAGDICINEMLLNNFGFKKNQLPTLADMMVTLEAVFGPDHDVASDLSMEEYYEMLPDGIENRMPDFHEIGEDDEPQNAGEGSGEDISKEVGEIMKDIADDLSQDDMRSFQAGTGDDIPVNIRRAISVKKLRDWYEIVDQYSLYGGDRGRTDWRRSPRRLAGMAGNFILPTKNRPDKRKAVIWLYLDTSGSCDPLIEPFFYASDTFPENRFLVHKFGFTTNVYDIRDKKSLRSGGTSFEAVARHASNRISQEGEPDAVIVFTDGESDLYGNGSNINFKNWHWLLKSSWGRPNKNFGLSDTETNKYMLDDFVDFS